MPGMLELPNLPLDAVEEREPILRVRHSITNTNYYVQVYALRMGDRTLREAVPASQAALDWFPVNRLAELPLTGLARKVLLRVDLLSIAGPQNPSTQPPPLNPFKPTLSCLCHPVGICCCSCRCLLLSFLRGLRLFSLCSCSCL